jgi:hypothetical protein
MSRLLICCAQQGEFLEDSLKKPDALTLVSSCEFWGKSEGSSYSPYSPCQTAVDTHWSTGNLGPEAGLHMAVKKQY